MILCTDRLVLRLLAGFEASRNALDQLVEETLIEEGHRVSISIRDGRDHPVERRGIHLVCPSLCPDRETYNLSVGWTSKWTGKTFRVHKLSINELRLTHHVTYVDDKRVLNGCHGMPCAAGFMEYFESAGWKVKDRKHLYAVLVLLRWPLTGFTYIGLASAKSVPRNRYGHLSPWICGRSPRSRGDSDALDTSEWLSPRSQ